VAILAAALRRGNTFIQNVARRLEENTGSRRHRLACFAAVILGVILLWLWRIREKGSSYPSENSPEVLAKKYREIIRAGTRPAG